MSKHDREIDSIERDLADTRARTESTIHALQERLQPRAVLDETTRFFRGTDSGQYAEDVTRNALKQARENPLPAAMILAGAALLATKRPGRPRYVETGVSQGYGQAGYDDYGASAYADYTEADYAQQDEELSSLYDAEWEETHRIVGAHDTIESTYVRGTDEDEDAYQNRLYEARGRAFNVDRTTGEDDSSFRSRVDDRLAKAKTKRDEYRSKASDFRRRQGERASRMRDRASGFASRTGERASDFAHGAQDRASNLAHGAGDRASAAYASSKQAGRDLAYGSRDAARKGAQRTGEFYEQNPLVGALVAVVAGAVAGSLFDTTRQERRVLGGVADDINDGVREMNERANQKIAEYARTVQHAAEDADDRVSEVERDLGGNASTTSKASGATGESYAAQTANEPSPVTTDDSTKTS